MKNILFRSATRSGCLLSLLYLTSSCGNSWMTTSERENTPSAMLLKAAEADDHGNYDVSIPLYQKILDQDPTNDDVRIRLTYALNGKAGLGLFDLVEKMASATTSSTSTDTSTSTSTSTGNSSLDTISKIVGLGATEKSAITTQYSNDAASTMAQLRSQSQLLSTLHEGWLAICRVLPEEILASVVEGDSVVNSAKEGDKCKHGLPAAQVKGSAKFAAALQLVSEAMVLYQSVLDSDGNGELDILTKATKVAKDISDIQTQVSSASGTQITSLLSTLNNSMAQLKDLGNTFKGEVVATTLADFSLVADLIASIDGLPDDIKTNITSTVDKFSDAKQQMSEFSNASTTKSSSSTSSSDPTAATQQATEALNQLNTKIATLPADQQAAAQEQVQQACTNFDAVKTLYNLPADTQAPTSCSSSSSLTDTVKPANFAFTTNSTSFGLNSNPVSETQFGMSMVDFARFGESIRPR